MLPYLIAMLAFLARYDFAAEVSLESAPPVVVRTVPVAGATDTDPALAEIRVTYSKAMRDGSWSWSTWGEENYPETTGKPRYLGDARTCVLPVKLKPNKFYAIWLNSDKFKNFRDANGRPAVPYLLTFRTAETPDDSGGPATFERVVETILKSPESRVAELLDLDTGQRATSTRFGENDRETHAWIREHQLDVLGIVEKGQIAVLCNDMVVVPALETSFDLITAGQIRTNWNLAQGEPNKITAVSPATDKTDTWFFRTREDGYGLLQILGESNDPRGVRIRYKLVRNSTSAVGAEKETSPTQADFNELLNSDQRAVLAWTDRQFRSYFDGRTFAGWSDTERTELENESIDALKGPRSQDYYRAINTLGALHSTNALPALRAIAYERVDRNNRDRWMAIRTLGMIGDPTDVPTLIQLVYHGNINTRWWAQISLVQITGQNFGNDWNAWGKWWNDQKGEPPYDPEIIRWWDGQAEPDKLMQSLEESDQKFLADLKGKSAATPAVSSTGLAAKIRAAEPTMNGIRENWSAVVNALDASDNVSALAAARRLAPHMQNFLAKFSDTPLATGTTQALDLLRSLIAALEKDDQSAVQKARTAMMTLGQSMEAQIKTLTDLPKVDDPFTNCRLASFGGEQSEGKQSYGGRGPALRFQPSELVSGIRADEPIRLKGVRLYAGRYGGGYTPEETTLRVTVRDAQDTTLAETRFAYAKFGFEAKWVNLVFESPVVIAKPGEPITIAFDPEAAQTKGIYFHYQKDPATSHSLAGTVSSGFKETPDREWMILVAFE